MNKNIPGTYPKSQIRNPRNVDADHFIQAYLKNEKEKMSNIKDLKIRFRNPLYADSAFFQIDSSKQIANQSLPIVPQAKGISRQEESIQQNSTKVKESSIRKSQQSLASEKQSKNQVQLEPIRQNLKQMETEKKSMNRKKSEGVLAYDNSFKMERYEKLPYISPVPAKPLQEKTLEQNLDKFFDVDSENKSIKSHKYIWHNPIGHQQVDYQSKHKMVVKWDKYNRPQFKDSLSNQLSPAQVIQMKNKLSDDGLRTSNKSYGYGLMKQQ